MNKAARIHIFMDAYGWSPSRNARVSQLKYVQNASELPPIDRDCIITFFDAENAGDLEYLQDRIQELRSDAQWGNE